MEINLFCSYQCRFLGGKSAFMNCQEAVEYWPQSHSTNPSFNLPIGQVQQYLLRIFCHSAQKLPVKDTVFLSH